MVITPFAPRTPYSAVSAGSFSTSIEAISCGLTTVRYPLGPGSIATPSSTYSGVLPLLMDEPPRIRTANPPSDVRITSTPGKRPVSTCSTDWPGALAISSDVPVECGSDVEGGEEPGAGASAPDVFRWAQAELSPMTMLTGTSPRI